MKSINNKLKENQRGVTILEVLIAALITAIITSAAFTFFTKMNEQSEHQFDVSEMHQMVRTSLHDIKSNLMQAGFKLNGHPPYEISGDTLAVYFSDTQPVDTILYYLEEFSTAEYNDLTDLPSGHRLYKLVKKVNSGVPSIFADYLSSLNYNQIDAANFIVTMVVHSMRKDDSYQPNDGYRLYSLSERVMIRNIS